MSGHRAFKMLQFKFYDHLKLAKKRKNDDRLAPTRVYIGNVQEKISKPNISSILHIFQVKLVFNGIIMWFKVFDQTFEIDIKLPLNCTGFLESIIYVEFQAEII